MNTEAASDDHPVDADPDDISSMIPLLAREHRALAGVLLKDLGLYPGQELVLMLLWQRDGRLQSELCRLLVVEPPTIAKMMRRLEDKGLVSRAPSSCDTRQVVISLTAAGKALEETVGERWSELERETVNGLSAAQRRELASLLATVTASVQSARADTE